MSVVSLVLSRLLLLFFLTLGLSCADIPLNQSGLSTSSELILEGRFAGERFGAALDFVGDVNGDGAGDFVIGAPGNTENGPNAGAVYLFLSPLSTDPSASTAQAIQIRGTAGEGFGQSVVGLGDINADGLDDFAIGAPDASLAGKVYIFKGTAGTGLSGSAPFVATDADLNYHKLSLWAYGRKPVTFSVVRLVVRAILTKTAAWIWPLAMLAPRKRVLVRSGHSIYFLVVGHWPRSIARARGKRCWLRAPI